jgi:hypothetical protein
VGLWRSSRKNKPVVEGEPTTVMNQQKAA